MSSPWNLKAEWLEADGRGGFACGTVSGIRTRRYHSLLLTAQMPPTGRRVFVNGFDAWVERNDEQISLSTQYYSPGVTYPDSRHRIQSFHPDPWPRWQFLLEDGTSIEHEIFVPHGMPFTVISWRLSQSQPGTQLCIRPFISGRDYHCLHKENASFRFDAQVGPNYVSWRPYAPLPSIRVITNAHYLHEPVWYRQFFYEEEQRRGLDYLEDLASPGRFVWDLSHDRAILILSTEESASLWEGLNPEVEKLYKKFACTEEKRRRAFPSRLHRSAEAYVVQRGRGKTIIAGYPWFVDWGRDTFISMRGLCLSSGELETAQEILLEWSEFISEGMLPNRFVDGAELPEYNSVDASLWYVIAIHDLFQEAQRRGRVLSRVARKKLEAAIIQILTGYKKGTRHHIYMDQDGLLAAGEPGVQLTWMDAKMGDWIVTSRMGKPVEVQALWLNALKIGLSISSQWEHVFQTGFRSFCERFWNQEKGCLFDVIDVDHEHGKMDASIRPNQILALGGLPFSLMEGERARGILDVIERRLLTPWGLRSLDPADSRFAPSYVGGPAQRDAAYHQGTVWPWLLGPFVEAWIRVRGNTLQAKKKARVRFLDPLLLRLDDYGIGHIPEIADGNPPHTPRGCPFQAWSLGEVLRLMDLVMEKKNPATSI